jgi:hypothetical protein
MMRRRAYINFRICCILPVMQEVTVITVYNLQVMKLVLQDAVVLQEARRLRDSYCRRALDTLKCLSNSDARTALQNIIRATVAV